MALVSNAAALHEDDLRRLMPPPPARAPGAGAAPRPNGRAPEVLDEDTYTQVRHHLERPDPRDPATRALLLEGAPADRASDGFGSSGQAPMTLLPAAEHPVNNLFYDSSQRPPVPLSSKELAEVPLGPPKAINAAATRIKGGPEAMPYSALPMEGLGLGGGGATLTTAASAAALAAAALAAGVPASMAAAAAAAAAAGGTMGYSPMATPSLDGMMSPLMTWGDIASTPLRLGADDMPVALDPEGGGGPAFRVQGMTEREATAHRLAAAKAGSGSAAGRVAGRLGGSRGGTPLLSALRRAATGSGAGGGATARGGGGGATPLGVPLSPAARQLAANIKGRGAAGGGAGGGGGRGGGGGGGGGQNGGARRGYQGGGGGAAAAAAMAAAAAARSAARSSALGSGELDKQLRASYRSASAAGGGGSHSGTPSYNTPGGRTAAGTPGVQGVRVSTGGGAGGGGGAHRTPVVASGGARPGPGVGAGAASVPVPKAAGGAAAGATGGSNGGGGGASVTDDLLKL
ncbi:hypothetical protein TSOC_002624 [Tetrabaena socialis]|uniref:Protein DGCR14 n=1 Tax=Tetrabaena socialis TaxID=47790 RepID=A0A2J8ADS3_9CHLO|nr:hypothetical protein TSOC_002624 [Tetrabaena socialis]|eukprot:PNH10664.1 hypothetical protein TSOC_002624 [Tetrabaena socialis]